MRFLLRLSGYILIAAGFVALVLDGTRSIANAAVQFTALGDGLALVLRERMTLLQPLVERNLHPLLWTPVLTSLLRVPACLAALAAGLLLLRLGSPPRPLIGTVTRR